MSIGVVESYFSAIAGLITRATEPVDGRSAFAQPPQNLSSARFTAPQLLQPPGSPLPHPPQ